MKKTTNQPSSLPGKLWMIGMGIFLMAAGGFFVWYLWAFFQKSGKMDDWVETPCVIEKSAIDSSEKTQNFATKHRLVTAYRYQFEGKEYLGEKYSRLQPVSTDRKKIVSKQEDYPAGSPATCFVNPENPAMAVLRKDTKASIYSIWFPGLFVLGGLGMVIAALRSWRS